MGTLAHDKGQVRFKYDREWLEHSLSFALDPHLTLDAAPFFPNPKTGNFGIFLDSSPDRWGQTLMQRREVIEARDEGRKPRTLYAWDYLIGVQDLTRQGALRFKREGDTPFLADSTLSAPPVARLAELEAVARELTSRKIDDLDALKRWLAVLVAPGSSLGGARPKANFTEADGSLWIAKFPSKDDVRDVGAWEMLTHRLAIDAGIDMPQARMLDFGGEYHTYCVKRFDRHEGRRVFYASAMTMLRREDSEGASYLDLAQFLMANGSRTFIKQDLEQLFRRVVFNIAVGNRDDHLRNHGFLMTKDGWRLAPAFDVNPNLDKAVHVLNIDDRDNHPSLENALATVELYELTKDRAIEVTEEVIEAVSPWISVARKFQIANADIHAMETAFLTDEMGNLLERYRLAPN
ncbi:type II toxin-antitoxin system HipA family toxin [Ferrovum sp.]|uniref:type II toxin-antitoxin system HipA family toxin n=1 Tax=Ferrovum sp. TaxID=2609467 RepID=UPI00260B245B|nr:type II toxin-antitoxin system HipA family toxin [Ferrovum sp.]